MYVKEDNKYDLSYYETDAHLLWKIRSGKGDPNIYKTYSSIYSNTFFAGTVPEKIEVDYFTGESDILNARASRYITFTDGDRKPNLTGEWYQEWEKRLQDETVIWNESDPNLKVVLFTFNALITAFLSDIFADFYLILTSIVLVLFYTLFVLGSCSPMHLRTVVGFWGLLCVGIAYIWGFAAAGTAGIGLTGIHALMPFLLIGIGVDDMFVMCNALD